jgi:hypothetical protein
MMTAIRNGGLDDAWLNMESMRGTGEPLEFIDKSGLSDRIIVAQGRLVGPAVFAAEGKIERQSPYRREYQGRINDIDLSCIDEIAPAPGADRELIGADVILLISSEANRQRDFFRSNPGR